MICVKNLSHTYDNNLTQALDNVSFVADPDKPYFLEDQMEQVKAHCFEY